MCASTSAKAGTHNHRRQLLKAAVDHFAKTTSAAAYGSRIALRLSGTTWREVAANPQQNMTPQSSTEYDFTFSRHEMPESCFSFAPLHQRGRRECRMHAAPAVSCASCTKENAHEHTGSAEAIRHSPAQWLYGLYRALPGDEFVLSPSSAD